ncbi:ABC transporter ATP-binding protein [Luteimonas notoginsengisoli]|uniref:ABC transporter ATP-binding protein n=1 Tax=Luteimonas notoginsengisoli TaxID=1578200 RepID=A0ABV7UQ08_9GAMM
MSASIQLDRVSLTVPLYVQPERRARNWTAMLLGAAFDPPRRVHVPLLDEISFQAHEGDRVAILGRNGAGKSTLLRVLNGVYPMSSGNMQVKGSRQALLNMSLGFNGEATVRENIFLRGTAMRLKASDMSDKIESILEFAGLQEKSSHRLRTLSTGQKMRLGFAISTSVRHDIILMDEWVGAGDSDFMAKATERMKGHMSGSKIVMLASHSVGLLRSICNKGIVLEQGRLVYSGDVIPALEHYHDLMASLRSTVAMGAPDASDLATPLVYGCAEKISFDDGVIQLHGWITSTNGSTVQGVALEVAGVRYVSTSIVRNRRSDVARHFGLRDQNCGFTASFVIPHLTALENLGVELRILGGADGSSAHTPLRVAPAVTASVRGNVD